jgi:hypothetical protein
MGTVEAWRAERKGGSSGGKILSYKVRKLVVGKGKTTTDEKAGEWIKNYYEIEIEIPDEHELSIAKENAEGLLNDWLSIAEEPAKHTFNWNPDKIVWNQAEGSKGPYERSEDVNNPEFKSLLKDLADHDGKLTRNGFFFWVFQNGSIIGRKKRKQS